LLPKTGGRGAGELEKNEKKATNWAPGDGGRVEAIVRTLSYVQKERQNCGGAQENEKGGWYDNVGE